MNGSDDVGRPIDYAELPCSFCGLVRRDIVAGGTEGLYICGECALLVVEILREGGWLPPS